VKLSLHTIKRHTAPLAWMLASILLLFPVSVHAFPGIVLCIEADGHVTVEDAQGLFCGPDASPHEHADDEALGQAEDASHCGSCIDIPLRVESDKECASFRLERAPAGEPVSPAAAVLPVPVPARRATSVPAPHTPGTAPGPSPLAALRSVVLLA
jgi:hypothetical protein